MPKGSPYDLKKMAFVSNNSDSVCLSKNIANKSMNAIFMSKYCSRGSI